MYFVFFMIASQISPMIKIDSINLYAESAESQFLIKIQGLNNCMFRKILSIFSVLFFQKSLVLFILQYTLNVMQNYVKQASQNMYVQQLLENSKSADKAGEYTVKRSKNLNRKPTTWYCNPSTN